MSISSTILLILCYLLITSNIFLQNKNSDIQTEIKLPANGIHHLQDTVLANKFIDNGEKKYKEGQYNLAVLDYKKAKDIYDELSKFHQNKNIPDNLVWCYNEIGWDLLLEGKFKASMQNTKKALEIGIKKFGRNYIEVAQSYHNMGSIYLYKFDYDKALEYFKKSLTTRLKLLGNKNYLVADDYHSIGNVYYEKGDYFKAMEYNQKALSIRLQLTEEVHSLINENNLAASYNNIGSIELNLGDYNKALEYDQKALSIRIKLFGKKHTVVIESYINIGNVYEHEKELAKALNYYEKALASSVRWTDKYTSYTNIGNIYLKKGNYKYALVNYRKSLSIMPKNLEKFYTAKDFKNIAEVYYRKKDYDTALTYCQKALTSLVPGFNNISVYSNPPLRSVHSKLNLLAILKLKAKIFSNRNEDSKMINLKEALSTFNLSVNLIDKILTGYKSESSKLFLEAKVYDIYDQAIHTCITLFDLTKDEKYEQQAFLFAEKSKATVLQEDLAEVQAEEFAKIPSSLVEKEKQLKTSLAFYDTQLQKELQKKTLQESDKINRYQNHLFDLKNQYDQLISYFEKNYPEYYNLKYQTKTATVPEIQNQLPSNTTLLEYFTGDSMIYIFSVSKEKFNIHSIKKPNDYQQLVRKFYSSIVKAETEDYITSADSLSKLIIVPVINEIKDREKLVIIPHNELLKIPFGALLTKEINPSEIKGEINFSKLSYLIKSFDISYHYSASLYINSLREKAEMISANERRSFIGFAPVFSDNVTTGYTISHKNLQIASENSSDIMRSIILNGKRFTELKYSAEEVKSIERLFAEDKPGSTSIAFFHEDATEDNFKKNIKNYRIIHIATHSFINEQHPEISGIVFARPKDSTDPEDGILYAAETYNLNLTADLVVLSSCESGLGKLIRGEGMMALTRGFLYSGASNVIFSLWNIPDLQTSELMIDFYRHMLSGESYSESLREAKLKLISNPSSARPRSWASFVLVGSDR